MAHTKYTGKTAASSFTFANDSLPTGCRKITIAEQGRPAAATIDVTTATDAAYVFVDDPMGGTGAPSATVTIEGFLSVTDHYDSGILATAIGTLGDFILTKAAGGDEYTLFNATLKSITTEAAVGAVVPYTVTFESTVGSGLGLWATAA